MSDITLCVSASCTERATCKRATTMGHEYWQSVANLHVTDLAGRCVNRIPILPKRLSELD